MGKTYTSRGVSFDKKVVGGESTFTILDILSGGSDLKTALVDVCKHKGADEEGAWQLVDQLCQDVTSIIKKAEQDIRDVFIKPFPNTGDRYDAVIKEVKLLGHVIAEYFTPYWEERMYDYDENGNIRDGEVIKRVPAYGPTPKATEQGEAVTPTVETTNTVSGVDDIPAL